MKILFNHLIETNLLVDHRKLGQKDLLKADLELRNLSKINALGLVNYESLSSGNKLTYKVGSYEKELTGHLTKNSDGKLYPLNELTPSDKKVSLRFELSIKIGEIFIGRCFDLGIGRVANKKVVSTSKKKKTLLGQVYSGATGISYRSYSGQIPFVDRETTHLLMEWLKTNNGRPVMVTFDAGEVGSGVTLFGMIEISSFNLIGKEVYGSKFKFEEIY